MVATTRSRTRNTQRVLRSGRRVDPRDTSGIGNKRALKSAYDRLCATNLGPEWTHVADVSDPRMRSAFPSYRVTDCVKKNKTRPPPGPRAFRLPADFPTNLTRNDVAAYLLNYHKGRKTNRPLNHAPIFASPGENRCTGNQPPRLTATQTMLHALAWAFARGGLSAHNKGLLAWHSTGSGKTCSAASVMHACWNTPRKLVYCTTVEAKRANPPANFVECFRKFFPAKDVPSVEAMAKRVDFLSFAQMAHRLDLWKGSKGARRDLYDDAVVLVDEVQNLFKPIPGQAKEHEALEAFLLDARNERPNLKIIILTATPGSSVSEVYRLLNLVRDRRQAPLRVGDDDDTVRRKVRGVVQHYDSNLDTSRFPTVEFEPMYECTLSPSHTREYYAKLAELLRCATPTCRNAKTVTLRKYSNAPFQRAPSSSEATHSCKFHRILQTVDAYPTHKHWIYSAFYENRGYGQGTTGLKKMLEARGYQELTPRMAAAASSNGLTARPRFCMVTRTALANKQDLDHLLRVYNAPENRDGALCRVMLASNKYNEGVDLKAVRHIHLAEPLVSRAMVDQAVGRARRFCSHAQLASLKDWTVRVHEYYARPDETVVATDKKFSKSLPNHKRNFAVDFDVAESAREQDRPIRHLYKLLREMSVDRLMFAKNNTSPPNNAFFTPPSSNTSDNNAFFTPPSN